jgi:hypothetical protein
MAWQDSSYNELNRGAFGRLAYTAGPVTIGVPPDSEHQYSGYWSAYYDTTAATVRVQPVERPDADVPSPETGASCPYFHSVGSPRQVTNLSAAFDNYGQFIFAIQDNSTSPPTIRVAGSGGAYEMSWAGYNPVVFNGVEMLTGHYATGTAFTSVYSGAVGCLYTDATNSRLYARWLIDAYTERHDFTLGGTTGYFLWLAGGVPATFSTTPLYTAPAIEPYEWDAEDAYMQIGLDTAAYEHEVRRLSGMSSLG